MYYLDTSAILAYVNQEEEHDKAKKLLEQDYGIFWLVEKEFRNIYEKRRTMHQRLSFYLNRFKNFKEIKSFLQGFADPEDENEKRHFAYLFLFICEKLKVSETQSIDDTNREKYSQEINGILYSQQAKFQALFAELRTKRMPHINFHDPRYQNLRGALIDLIKPETQWNDFHILTGGIWYALSDFPNLIIVAKDGFFSGNNNRVKNLIMQREGFIEEELPFEIMALSAFA